MQVKYVRQRQYDVASESGPTTRVFEVGDIVDLPELHARMEIMQGYADLEGDEPVEEVVDEPLNAPVTTNDPDPADEPDEAEDTEPEDDADPDPADEPDEAEEATAPRRSRRSPKS